jgi:hypothetical protein
MPLVWNELKYDIEVIKNLEEVPEIWASQGN